MIKYKVEKINNDIFAITVPDRYDLAMLFCRVQEFYESPNRKIRNKVFSIWDYYSWYSKTNSGCFSYVKDYCGFNLPIKIARKCYSLNKIETPYDKLFKSIINDIKSEDGYVIGVDKINTSTFYHELCHGLYYTNKKYKKEMDAVTRSISKFNINKFKKNLREKGYCMSVFNDEMQAYMSTEINKTMTAGMVGKASLHKKYKLIFDSYK